MLFNALQDRRGAALPTFAAVFPLIVMFSAFSINLAYVQLCKTEMKIAADVSAHAGGRRMGTPPRDDDGNIVLESPADARAGVMATAQRIAGMNMVAGYPVTLAAEDMEFGRSKRFGIEDSDRLTPYEWYETITSNDKIPSSFRVVGTRTSVPLIFGPVSAYGTEAKRDFFVRANSVATQVDRDVALVLDRSGSMLTFEDEDGLNATLLRLKNETTTETITERKKQYKVKNNSNGQWGWYFYDQLPSSYSYYGEYRWRDRETTEERSKISQSEYNNATKFSSSVPIYYRSYSANVIKWLERDANPLDTLGDTFGGNGEAHELTIPQAIYAYDYQYRYKNNYDGRKWAPRFSRWFYLERGVDVFLNVLEGGNDPGPTGLDDGITRSGTVQEEQVGLVTFNSSAYLNYTLATDYQNIRTKVADVVPGSGTGIGDAIVRGKDVISDTERSRPFAAKTIIVLSDGDNNSSEYSPVNAARDHIKGNDITVHTVTFTEGVSSAGKAAMSEVAAIGYGRHYHTNEGAELVQIFEEIANNLPTILTK